MYVIILMVSFVCMCLIKGSLNYYYYGDMFCGLKGLFSTNCTTHITAKLHKCVLGKWWVAAAVLISQHCNNHSTDIIQLSLLTMNYYHTEWVIVVRSHANIFLWCHYPIISGFSPSILFSKWLHHDSSKHPSLVTAKAMIPECGSLHHPENVCN